MSNKKLTFTISALEKITPPATGKSYHTYYDSKEKGLVLIVSSGGTKSFYLYMKVNGKPERIKLGSFPDLSIDKARELTVYNRSLIAQGINPNEKKRQLRQESTLSDLYTKYMERYSKIEKKSWKEDDREINRYLSHWFNRRLSTIEKYEIRSLHQKLKENCGLYQANRILRLLKSMFNKAIEWEWKGSNPTLGIKQFREEARERFIYPEEMPRFMKALEEDDNKDFKDYVLLALFTGARRCNVLSMRWENINWSLNEWRIIDTKNGKPQCVPLPTKAVAILEKRKDNESEWVFPSKTSEAGHLISPKRAWKKFIERADLKDLRMHDLRRTMGSYQAINGSSLTIIGKSLGHRSAQVTQIYARLHNDPVRKSMEGAVNSILEAS